MMVERCVVWCCEGFIYLASGMTKSSVVVRLKISYGLLF